MLSTALATATPTLRDWASRIGGNYGTVRAYRLGTRGAPPAVLRTIAAAFRRHARELERYADHLDREAERDP
jgi:hypothetical protein